MPLADTPTKTASGKTLGAVTVIWVLDALLDPANHLEVAGRESGDLSSTSALVA